MNTSQLQVIEIFTLYIGLAAVLSFGFSFLFRYLRKWRWYEHHIWISTFLIAIEKPMQWLIWLSASFYLTESLSRWMDLGEWTQGNGRWLRLLWVVAISWVLLNWKKQIEEVIKQNKHFQEKTSLEKATTDAIGRLLSIVITTISGLMALQIIGVPIESLLAVGAVGAAGIAWASTDVVKNFFGGLMIHITRPFGSGDWINSPEKEIEGVVEEIGWYQTRIRTFDKRPIYVPNGLFTSIVLRNPSRMSNRQILADIGLRYEDLKVIPTVVNEIKEMLKEHPEIDQNQFLMVHFTGFNPYSVGINVYCFTKTTAWSQWRDVQQDVLLQISRIVEDNGAQITLPVQQFYLKSSSPESFLPVAVPSQFS